MIHPDQVRFRLVGGSGSRDVAVPGMAQVVGDGQRLLLTHVFGWCVRSPLSAPLAGLDRSRLAPSLVRYPVAPAAEAGRLPGTHGTAQQGTVTSL